MDQSPNMNLILWDDLDDPYDHVELKDNWMAVDDHDHSLGKGVKISATGLADGAVTNNVLAPDSVTTDKILNHTILGEDLADGAIGIGQIDPAILSMLVPLGMVAPWFRPSSSVPVPEGWVVADGSTVVQGSHGWGTGSVTIPDLRNRFVLGAATIGTGTGVTTPPAERAIGGAHTHTYPHTHPISSHTHTTVAHSHTVNSHTHVGPAHSHGIGADGAHDHFTGEAWRGNVNVEGNKPGVHDYPEAFAFQDHGHNTSVEGSHNHGGGTAVAAGTTEAAAPGTNAAAPNTNANTAALATQSANGGGDVRPAFVGLLYIIKVKNPV